MRGVGKWRRRERETRGRRNKLTKKGFSSMGIPVASDDIDAIDLRPHSII
jgi:hypothetical protein